jgi:hypothetical protein
MKTVVAWSINIEYEDGTSEDITEVPNYIARDIDEWLQEEEDD